MALIDAIKEISSNANEEGKPADVVYGTVTSANPLSIYIDQKYELDADFLVLTRNVTDYEQKIEIAEPIPTTDGEHQISGEYTIKVKNALQSGEKVIMMQAKGGQKFIVLDRIG